MSLYPGALPAVGSAVSTNTLAVAGHTALHNTSYDEIRAIATKVGTGASTPTNNTVLRGNGSGTSTWSQVGLTTDVTGTLPQANGGTGTTSATGTGAAVYATSPTISGAQLTGSPSLTTPTIADFTNAQHGHTNAAGGGQLGTNAHTNASITPDKLSTGASTATVSTSETTTSTSFADLATTGPTVSNINIGANGLALVSISCAMSNATSTTQTSMGFAISGASTQAASATYSIAANIPFNGGQYRLAGTFLISGLTPGATTFTAKYLTNANTATFSERMISVVPL